MNVSTGPVRVVVNITEQDIRDGIDYSACSCPGALALNRVLGFSRSDFPTPIEVLVWPSSTDLGIRDDDDYPYTPRLLSRVENPEKLKEFISLFDAHGVVQPVSYEIAIPADWVPFCPALWETPP